MSRKLSSGFSRPLLTPSLSRRGSVVEGARSGSSVPALMPLAIWVVESRLVVRCTVIPDEASKGFNTSRYALSSLPPQATHCVTLVVFPEEPLVLEPPQAASKSKPPRHRATARQPHVA